MSHLSFGEALGEGAAGTVYAGTWQGQRVAIKKLPGRHTRAADQEIQLVSKLKHDNVVRYFNMEKDSTAVYLVMELISGGTLFDFIQREFEKSNYWITTCKILRDIANGMNYLHEQNIVHGDLKSHNILLRENSYQAVICDFGLSKTLTVAQSHKTKKGSIAQGTIRWMAPELCRPPTERLSLESDVWAYGCVILEITSGDIPWINQFEKDEPLFYALQEDGTRQGPIFAHVCATQKAPTKVRELLCLCCTWSKKNRPKFSTIMQTLDNISSNDLKNVTQITNKSMPAPPTETLSRMSIRTRQDDSERRAQEEREKRERRDRSEEERRRRREQDRRDDERRAEERRNEERKAEERRIEERKAEERRIEERKAEERQAEERRIEERRAEERRAEDRRYEEQESKTSQRRGSSRRRPMTNHGDSSDSDNGGGEMMMPFGGGGIMTPYGGGGGGGTNLFGGFARPQATMGNGLPAGNQYTGQLYASRGVAHGRPLVQGPCGGTYYVTPSGGKRYV